MRQQQPPSKRAVSVPTRGIIRRCTTDPTNVGTQLPITLVYGESDPFAAWFILGPEADRNAWAVSRNLLVEGLDSAAGVGDVRVWPLRPACERLVVAFSSPEGHLMFDLSRRVVARFLRGTFIAVPRGREDMGSDVDEAIARMRPEVSS